MKILVLGGSYFLGKHFVHMASKENEITVFNRGNRPLKYDGINEIIGDRHKKEDVEKLNVENYDVVVDFCAYDKGDISEVINNIGPSIKQYIFISTVDVYKKGTHDGINENSPLETTTYGGEVGQYIAGKVALEHELKMCCKNSNISYTSVRPVIIYGPDNYAPREGVFFNWIDKAGQVLVPEDESGYFQMIYVDDLAKIIMDICGNEKCYNQAVNVCGDGLYNYKSFLDALRDGCNTDFLRIELPVRDILDKEIALPYPITSEESEKYCSIFNDLFHYNPTSLSEGLKMSYQSFHEL